MQGPERVVYRDPDCTIPPKPSPPEIEAGELAPLPDDVYWRVRERDRILTDWGLELDATARPLCDEAEPAQEREGGRGA